MTIDRMTRGVLLVVAIGIAAPQDARAQSQCGLANWLGGCCKKPVYAVAPVMAPVAAPIMAPVPIPAPPPPVMVPVQQTSYVPETTYRTQYQCVPVTSYKPSCEIDPCTGCPRECMEPVTQYVQQAVNVPVTQYRAVTTTKYVQMQPGYAAAGGPVVAPAAAPVPYPAPPAAVAPAASPFAAPVQTTPQAWGAAGSDVPNQLLQGQPSINAPTLPPTGYPQPTFQQPIVPQAGTYAPSQPAAVQPQPAAPPALSPAPSLRPIPEMPRANAATGAAPYQANGSANGTAVPPPSLPRATAPATSGSSNGLLPVQPSTSGSAPQPTPGGTGMPVLPGGGPTGATGAFPRLLAPTGHTTAWQPAVDVRRAPSFGPRYPAAALPSQLTQ
jgi:hypothetical protein